MNIKRIIAFLLLASMLLLACACNGADAGNTDDSQSGADQSNNQTGDKEDTTDAPLAATDILLSDPSAPVRIVYADGAKGAAVKIYDKLTALDVNFTIGKYSVVKDNVAEDGSAEIVIGDTNRAASAEAKKLITESGDYYSVYISGNTIALYSDAVEGLEEAAADIITKMSKKGKSVIYNGAKGSYAKAYQKYTLLEALVKTAKDEDLPVYRISVYDADGLKTETINASNPCQDCYSVAKVYCVTAIGMLYDEGKIDTTDTIGAIFADELAAYGIDPTAWNKVTIHDVMRHRAGFEHGLLDIDAEDSTQWSSQDYLKLVLSEPLVSEPGEKYVYTDAAFYLISRVVTKISGEKLDDFLAARLFKYTDCREFAFSKCPEGYPIGATGLYIRSADVAKLGRIYLDGGKYGDVQIISQEWINKVLENGYELGSSGSGYAKGGMRGQYLYINFEKNVAVAWHSYDPNDETGALGDTLHSYMSK